MPPLDSHPRVDLWNQQLGLGYSVTSRRSFVCAIGFGWANAEYLRFRHSSVLTPLARRWTGPPCRHKLRYPTAPCEDCFFVPIRLS